ncbi:putative tail-fiber/lysozyme protein [Acinetobacter phage Ab69]|nr:putative tail-fiber/lysozyme protein [Acinetobacter phage Ab69]
MAENIVESIIVKLGLDGSQYNREAEKAKSNNDKLNKSVSETDKIVATVDQVQKLNDELYHLERNLGMSASTIKNWQGAAGAMGGSAQGMTESIKSLNMGMNDFVTMGDTTLLPFMNALGCRHGRCSRQAKKNRDREQAFSIASKMGIDEGTFNTLVQGRKEMEKMLEYQSKMYKSSEEELKASRQLAQNRALLGQHWESLKTMMANAIIRYLNLVKLRLGYLNIFKKTNKQCRRYSKAYLLAPFAPFILVVGALGAAFGLLYDDYKTWAEGGKSLFDWGAFRKYIDDSTLSVDNLKNAFSNLGKDMLNNAIPTLKGYAEILDKLVSGDFKGAASQAWDMLKNYYSRAADFVDDLTGQKQGTLANAASNLINRDNEPKPLPANRNISSGSSNNAILDLIAQGEVSTTAAVGITFLIVALEFQPSKCLAKNYLNNRNLAVFLLTADLRQWVVISLSIVVLMIISVLLDLWLLAMIRKGKYGLDAVRAGKATPEDFQNKVLAARWASIQKTTGGGVHDAAGFNKATIGSSAVAKAISSMRQNDYIDLTKSQQNKAIANKANEVQVNIGDINIQTSASTVSGNVNEAMGAVKDNFYQLRPSTN